MENDQSPWKNYTPSASPEIQRQNSNQPPQKTFMHHFGQGCLIVFIGLVILMAVGINSCAKMVSSFSSSNLLEDNSNLEGKVIKEGDNDDIIAVIDIKGVISGERDTYDIVSAPRVVSILNELKEEENIRAVIIDMDTPGGEVTASDEIYKAFLLFKEAKNVPLITCMHSMGASGGYYVASASDYIIANKNTFTGSIGVIMSSVNFTELMKKIGVEAETYRSGDMKDMLNSTRPRTEKEIKYLNEMIQETFISFTDIVAKGRPKIFKSGEDVRKAPLADGRVLSGIAAKEAGLVDELGYFDDAIAKATELSGAKSPNVIRYHYNSSWRDIFNMSARNIRPSAKDLLPVRSATLKAGRLYYIAPEAVAN